MIDYPSINWWPGNLRPHESVISLLARFCELNGTSLVACQDYFGFKNEHGYFSGATIERIASLLNEDMSVVMTVFSPAITFNHCGYYRLPVQKTYPQIVKFCKECAEHGYHSYLHEAVWLKKCPIHLTDLRTCYGDSIHGTATKQRIAALNKLMRSNCPNWPHADAGSFALPEQGQFQELAEWIESASVAASQLSQGEIWRSSENGHFSENTSAEVIGQLRTLNRMPTVLIPMFTEVGACWHLETRQFSLAAKAELARLEPYLGFDELFDFYKRICTLSLNPPHFVKKQKAVQEAIKARHGECHCRWAFIKAGWDSFWKQVDPNGWPRWQDRCPYEVVLQELEQGWGRWDLALSPRKLDAEMFHFTKSSHLMHDLGLIGYTPDANVSPEGYLYTIPQVWPCCDWTLDSPLTDLLNATAEFEFDSISRELIRWLDDIESGINPSHREYPTSSVRLIEKEDGLSLVHWIRPIRGQ